MNFHLKQHIRNIHEKKKSNIVQSIHIHNYQKLDENESAPKSITQIRNNLSLQIPTINDGLQDCKCEFCGKSFSTKRSLKKHIHTIHKGQKDHKCESCGKSFTEAGSLKEHIHTIHKGHKDHKCESCGKLYNGANNLKKHMYTVHDS